MTKLRRPAKLCFGSNKDGNKDDGVECSIHTFHDESPKRIEIEVGGKWIALYPGEARKLVAYINRCLRYIAQEKEAFAAKKALGATTGWTG